MATEKLKFRLELYATMWDRPPQAQIKINDKIYFDGTITGTENAPSVVEFEHSLAEGENHDLQIVRTGKSKKQTIINEKGDILQDQILHIKHVEIDEIDIGALVYEGVYVPKYPEPWAKQQREAGVDLPQTLKNVTSMGHNGTWTFTFSSPFYMWLLENLY
jgi:hypothetical protein